ncbi:MAG: phage integrase N-terminal SAM-like domain-containing protein [Nitrosomonas sp.]
MISKFVISTDIAWIKRFIFFHDKRRPNTMGERGIESFLNSSRRSMQCSCVYTESGFVRTAVVIQGSTRT